MQEYAGVKAQAAGLDPVELYEARQAIRPGYENAANEKLEQAFGDKYSPMRWMKAKQEHKRLVREAVDEFVVHQQSRKREKQAISL